MTEMWKKIWNSIEGEIRTSNDLGNKLVYHQADDIRGYHIFCSVDASTLGRGIIIRHIKSGKKYVIPPSSRGFNIRLGNLSNNEKFEDLIINISSEEFNDIFETFCDELISTLANLPETENLIEATIKHVRKWQRFMEKVSDHTLSPEQRKGLYGELHFLKNCLVPIIGVKNAISAWYGPEKKQQDFLFEGGFAVEVKTSVAKTPVFLHISSEQQLDPEGFTALYLYYVQIAETKDTFRSLNSIVDDILTLCLENRLDTVEFKRKLIESGYREKDREKYQYPGYAVVKETPYLVSEEFPNITRRGLKPGVCEVTYSISVDALNPYLADADEFRNHIVEEYKK